jgi:glutamine amidotransferase
MAKIAIVDYGMGNLGSMFRAVEECNREPLITNNPEDLRKVTHIIIPGVGAFVDGMRNLSECGLDQVIKEEVNRKGIPILGICLGMQLLATQGFEGGKIFGLDLIPGEVKRFQPKTPDVKIPHIGWNEVVFDRPCTLFKDIPSGKDFYFAHSYHFVCKNKEDIVSWTSYCGGFVSGVSRKNIFGVQFHPEKSLRLGLKLLSNFLSL